MYLRYFRSLLQIKNRYICNQAGGFISPAFVAAFCLYLYLHMVGIDSHVFGNHFGNVRLDQFHHFGGTIYPVRYQKDLQTVFCNLAGTFPAKKMLHIHLAIISKSLVKLDTHFLHSLLPAQTILQILVFQIVLIVQPNLKQHQEQ